MKNLDTKVKAAGCPITFKCSSDIAMAQGITSLDACWSDTNGEK